MPDLMERQSRRRWCAQESMRSERQREISLGRTDRVPSATPDAVPCVPRLRLICRALFHDDLPFPPISGAHRHAGVIFLERLALEFAFALPAMTDDGRAVAQHSDDDIGPAPVMQPIAGRADDSHDRLVV